MVQLTVSPQHDSSEFENQRKPVDLIGYPTTPGQADATFRLAKDSSDRLIDLTAVPDAPMIAAICPHDDHVYAGPLYVPVVERVRADCVILIGVDHGRAGHMENVIILDDYDTWLGPYGATEVDTEMRQFISDSFRGKNCVVNRDCHQHEHSLEAFIPFLQNVNRQTRIVPLLVAKMDWQTLHHTAERLAYFLADFLKDRSWQLGAHLQLLISNDSVHYGDQGWGGHNYAPFGTGCYGLEQGRNQDLDLVEKYLTKEIQPLDVRNFYLSLVAENDSLTSKISWCGRFSVPFGLMFSYYLALRYGKSKLAGHLFNYNTSVELGELPLRECGPGVTAPANLHHWVGYTSLGYFSHPVQ